MSDTTVGVSHKTHKALRRMQIDHQSVHAKPSLDELIYQQIPDKYKED